MASERQIAANRHNARKSTGPRSGAGKKWASGNAYRHGLTSNITSTAIFAKQLDKLVRKIAGETEDAMVLERARAIAHAELDLAQVRRAKIALIERACAFGALDPPRPKPIDALATMPPHEPDRSAEAVRRVLPELRKLDRYERRAAARRDRAVLNLLMQPNFASICSCAPAKRSQFF
jgi:hypothetical protein